MLEPKPFSNRIYLSKAGDLCKCAWLYHLKYHYHIQPKITPPYFISGRDFHKVMQSSLGYGELPDCNQDELLDYQEMASATLEELSKTLGEVIAVEELIELPMRTPYGSWLWTIKPDLLYKAIDEHDWICDFKSTSYEPSGTLKYYHVSPQTRTYFRIASHARKDRNFVGTHIIACSKPNSKRAPIVMSEPLKFTGRDEMIADLYIKAILGRLDAEYEARTWRMNVANCVEFKGARECPYFPLCYQTDHPYPNIDEQLVADWYKIEDPEKHLFE